MSTTYELDIATKTRYGIVNVDKLEAELNSDHVITATLESVVIDGTNVDITYATPLPTTPINHVTHLENLVSMHDGAAINVTTDAVYLEPTKDPTLKQVIHGQVFTTTLNTDTNHDVSFTTNRAIQGVEIEISDHTIGDHIRIAIIPESSADELQVIADGGASCSDGVPIPPSGAIRATCCSTSLLLTGQRIRFKYHSTGTSGTPPKLYVAIRTWK